MRVWAISIIAGLLTLSGCNLFSPPKQSGCQTTGDCKTGEVCLNHVCKSADAARCGSEAVCTEASTCASFACENGCCLKACMVQSECTSPLECTDGACRPPAQSGCSTDNDCTSATAPHCDGSTGACVACVSSDQCPPDGTCENHACKYPVKVGCDGDADCTDSLLPRCQTGTRTCVACLENTDCASSADGGMMICNKTINACEQVRTTCATDSDCNGKPLTPHCRVGDGVCVECQISAQCRDGKICFAENTCGYAGNCGSDLDCVSVAGKPYCDTDSRKCVECVDNTACSSGFGCGPRHVCEAATGCTRNAQCPRATPVCHTPSGICYGCLTNSDCGTDGTCTNYSCVYPPPPVCNRDLDCGTGKVCAAAVYPHDDQQAGNLCVPKEPGASYGPGHLCTSDSQCKSGLCLVAGLLGYCQGGCTADSDCQGADGTPGAGACTKINLYWSDAANEDHVTQVPSCVIECKAELDCYPYGTCLLAPNVTNTHWVTRCDPTVRTFQYWGGSVCASQADCGGVGTCIKRNGGTKGICSGMCGGSNGGVQSCAPDVSLFSTGSNTVPTCPASGVMLPLPGGTMQAAQVCWGPPCSTNADCPATDLGLTQWKCIAANLGNGTTQKFCHPP